MSEVVNSSELFRILNDFVELPKHTVECKLELKLGEAAIITCKYYPVVDKKLLTSVKVSGKYRLQNLAQVEYTQRMEELVE